MEERLPRDRAGHREAVPWYLRRGEAKRGRRVPCGLNTHVLNHCCASFSSNVCVCNGDTRRITRRAIRAFLLFLSVPAS